MNRTRLFPVILTGALLLSVSAQGAAFTATLNGLQEVPPNASTATGFVTVTLLGDLLTVDLSFTGLTNIASAGHIHCCTSPGTNAIVAVPFAGLPAATSGTYSNAFDLTLAATYNPAFITANGGTAATAEAAFIAGLNSFKAYANIHDSPNFAGGEIRGNLVPEPSTSLLLLTGLLGVAGLACRKNRCTR